MVKSEVVENPLWRICSFQLEQVVARGDRYDWNNHKREGLQILVLQLSLADGLLWCDAAGTVPVPAGAGLLFSHCEQSRYFLPTGHGDYRCRFLCLSGAGLHEHWRHLRASYGTVLPGLVGGPVDRSLRRAAALASAADPLQSAAAVQELVLTLHAVARGRRLAALGPAERAVEAIVASPCHPWSFKALAREHGCSREHLLRTFREQLGMPPAAWLKTRRLERALGLLRDSALGVADIAAQCGFGSAHTLTRLVRAATGMAPTRYREQVAP